VKGPFPTQRGQEKGWGKSNRRGDAIRRKKRDRGKDCDGQDDFNDADRRRTSRGGRKYVTSLGVRKRKTEKGDG